MLKSRIISSPSEAKPLTEEIIKFSNANKVMLKALVSSGGRGLGKFISGHGSGIAEVSSGQEAEEVSKKMIGFNLVTKQTQAEGIKCKHLLAVPKIRSSKSLYLAFLVDNTSPTGISVLGSEEGGVNIEDIAKNSPDKIIRISVKPDCEDIERVAKEMATKLNVKTEQIEKELTKSIINLFKTFKKYDCTLAEINPVFIDDLDKISFVDSKISIDESALFRQQYVESLYRKQQIMYGLEVPQKSPNFNYVKLDGNIGCLVNGAGLAMATMDLISSSGNRPANFLDVGGGSDTKSISEAMGVLFDDINVKVIFVNIFGGIINCEDIANTLVQTLDTKDRVVPIVARFSGNGSESADKAVSEGAKNLHVENDLEKALELVGKLAQGKTN